MLAAGALVAQGVLRRFVVMVPGFSALPAFIQGTPLLATAPGLLALNTLAGLERSSEGHVFMDGREVRGPSLERGVVFQSHALMPWLTVRQNIAFAVKSRWPEWKAPQVNVHVEKFVALVGLLPAID